MSNTSRVMSNREYEKFMKEKKQEAFKKCDPVVQGACSSVLTMSRIRRVLTQPSFLCGMGMSQTEQGLIRVPSAIVRACDKLTSCSMNNNTMLEAELAYLDQHRTKP